MDTEGKLEYIIENVPTRARFEQLAEEHIEAALACFKVLRSLGRDNPTRTGGEEAVKWLMEETGNVLVCSAALPEFTDLRLVDVTPDSTMEYKIDRWYKSIKAAKEGKDE